MSQQRTIINTEVFNEIEYRGLTVHCVSNIRHDKTHKLQVHCSASGELSLFFKKLHVRYAPKITVGARVFVFMIRVVQ